MTWRLRDQGHLVNDKRIQRSMGLMPIDQKPNTDKPLKGHKTCSCLLRDARVEQPSQVWCADVACIPMRRGGLHLVTVMDWRTRRVLAWRFTNTLKADRLAWRP